MDEQPKQDLETKVMCLNQIFRPKHYFPFITPPGKGNCTICTYDPEKNKYCTGYRPAAQTTFYVTPKQ